MNVVTERSTLKARRLAQLHPAALLAHCDQVLAGPMPNHVLDGLLDRMARLSPETVPAREFQRFRPNRPRRQPVTTPARKNLTVKLEWRDPPTSRQPDWRAVLEPLRQEPGKWARLVNDHRNSAVQRARAAARKAVSGPEWELVTRSEDDGTSSFYARYLSLDGTKVPTSRGVNGRVSTPRG